VAQALNTDATQRLIKWDRHRQRYRGVLVRESYKLCHIGREGPKFAQKRGCKFHWCPAGSIRLAAQSKGEVRCIPCSNPAVPDTIRSGGRAGHFDQRIHQSSNRGRVAHQLKTMLRIRKVFLILVTAGLLNILVAWGCTFWSPYSRNVGPAEKPDQTLPDEIQGLDGSMGWWVTVLGTGVSCTSPRIAEVFDERIFNGWKYSATPAYYRSGWPAKSMQSVVRYCQADDGHELTRWELPKTEILSRGLQTNDLPAWLHAEDDRRLPMMPMWAGFAANTVLYSLVLLGCRRVWILARVKKADSEIHSA
jgi:hypothetical protein